MAATSTAATTADSRPALWRDPAARFVAATAATGSLADWTLLAVLVATVDRATSGSVWATTLVLLAKILPAIAFAPLAARRVDGAPLARTLRLHEVGRIAAVGVLAAAAATGQAAVAVAGILLFEYCAAILAATREAYISRHVPVLLFTRINTVTAVLGYGLLPVGALLVHRLGLPSGWAVAWAGYGALALAYGWLPARRHAAVPTAARQPSGPPPASGRTAARAGAGSAAAARLAGAIPAGLASAVMAAGLGLVPVVMLFVVAPRLAAAWAAAPTATAPLTALVLAGGAAGFVAANRGAPAEVGLGTAAAGLAVAAAGPWQPGLVLLGFGAGVAYLGLQTRLQHLADAPSQFAAAFAVLKGCAAAATLAGPALYGRLGLAGTLLGGAAAAAVALAVSAAGRPAVAGASARHIPGAALRTSAAALRAAGATVRRLGAFLPLPIPAAALRRSSAARAPRIAGTALARAAGATVRRLARTLLAAALGAAFRVRVEGHRLDGPAVVVSNHPNAADGLLAMLADRHLRPVARWQRNPLARLGIWVGDCIVTTAGTDRPHRPALASAVAHLEHGGRVWLAPEGGAHTRRALRPPRSGALRMAHAAGVPIQALGIVHDPHPGPRLRDWRPWRRHRVTLRWGPVVRTCGIIDVDGDRMMTALAAASGMDWQPREVAA